MNSWWQMYRQAFSPEECKDLVEYALTHPVVDATIGYGGTHVVDSKKRTSKVRWLKRDDPQLFVFYARISAMAEEVNRKSFGFDLRYFSEVQFTEYDADDEAHFDWHIDNNWKSGAADDRKLSMVIQLSPPTDYQGGKLELQSDPLPEGMFVNQGDTIFFPAFNRHRVTPLTAGKRFSLVTWFKGPSFR